MKKTYKIPTLLALTLLFIALTLGVWFLMYQQKVDGEEKNYFQPRNIRITSVTDTTATVSWQTEAAIEGSLTYGQFNNFNLTAVDDRDTNPRSRLTHFITLRGLTPNSDYSFMIKNGRFTYNIQGFKTAQVPEEQSKKIYPALRGVILGPDKQPIDEAVVLLEIDGTVKRAAATTTAGNYILPINDLENLTPKMPARLLLERGNVRSEVDIILTLGEEVLPPLVLGENKDIKQVLVTPTPSPTPTPVYDLNGDGKVNSLDLSKMLQNMGKDVNKFTGDLNGDGKINNKDLDILKTRLK